MVNLLYFHNSSDNSMYSVMLSVGLSNNYFSIRMSSDAWLSERMCPSTSEQMCFSISVYHHNGLYLLRTEQTGNTHPASLGLLTHPAQSDVCFLGSGFVAQLIDFIRLVLLYFLNYRLSFAFELLSKKHVPEGVSPLPWRLSHLDQYFMEDCCLLWCLLHENLLTAFHC